DRNVTGVQTCALPILRFRFDSVFGQTFGHAFGSFPCLAINDAAFLWPSAQEAQHLLIGLAFGQHAIAQVGPIETGDVTIWFVERSEERRVGKECRLGW